MRKLNTLEKNILKKIVEYKPMLEDGMFVCNGFLGDNYIGKKYGASLAVSKSKEQFVLFLSKKQNENEKLRRQKIMFIITFFKLIDYLDKNGFIETLDSDSKNEEGMLGLQSEHMITFSRGLNEIVFNSFFKFIIVSQDLIDIIDNDFQTDERLLSIKNLKISRTGIIVAISIGLISSVISTVGLLQSNSEKRLIKIDSTQFKIFNDKYLKLIENHHKSDIQ
jgi:hypothetical protein